MPAHEHNLRSDTDRLLGGSWPLVANATFAGFVAPNVRCVEKMQLSRRVHSDD